MGELTDDLHEQIQALCAAGDDDAEREEYPAAIARYEAAWDLLPEPKVDWEASTWILAALGDAHFFSGDYERARGALGMALSDPDSVGNPFLHLRMGQSQFELGEMERAADELTRAYMGDGGSIFADEDPKYYDYIKSLLREPPGGWEEAVAAEE